MGDPDHPALIDSQTLEPTQAYYDSRTVIQEINKISDTFVQFRNLGAYTINGEAKGYLKTRDELQFKEFDAITVTTESPLLVGCFEKRGNSGAKACILVNMEELLRKTKKTDVTVKIENLNGQRVFSYRGGERTQVELDENGEFKVSMDSGEGIFYKKE